jgi:hypothetical protein
MGVQAKGRVTGLLIFGCLHMGFFTIQSSPLSLQRTYDANQRGELQSGHLAGGDTELV